MKRARFVLPAAVLCILGVFVAACDDSLPSEAPPAEPQLSTSSGPVLIECPTDTTLSATDTIDPLGGTVSVDGSSITVPAGAVLLPTEITLSVPASNYMEIEITANGEDSFEFQEAVTVAISYERCSRSNIDKNSLTAWQIDPETKALLEDMNGRDDKDARIVDFSTDHLSTYAIAD